jgi:hypothetical protein
MQKSLLFILALLIVSVTHSQAQFGIKGGLNFSNIGNYRYDDPEFRTGLHAGGFAQIGIADKLLFQPELQYSVKGHRFPERPPTSAGRVSFLYITAPLLFHYRATNSLSLLLGPELAYNVSAKAIFDGERHELTWFDRPFDFGVAAGVGYKITNKLAIDLRYVHGFSTLVEVTFTDAMGNSTGTERIMSNRVIQLGLNYLLSK